MIWVDEIDVIEVGCSCLISHVDRVFEWEVPYGEGLKLGITCLVASLVLVVELAKTYGHLATTRTRSSNDYQRTCSLDIIIFTKTLSRVNKGYIMWIAFDGVVVVCLYTKTLEALTVVLCRRLTAIVGDDYRVNEKTLAHEFLPKS